MILLMQTVGEILKPTKGDRSYTQIALKANEWLREKAEDGTYRTVERLSYEHVRRIFEDYTQRPNIVYLEALAAVQGVDRVALIEAAGYQVPSPPDAAPQEKIRLALRAYPELSEQDVEAVMASFQRILDRKREQRQKS